MHDTRTPCCTLAFQHTHPGNREAGKEGGGGEEEVGEASRQESAKVQGWEGQRNRAARQRHEEVLTSTQPLPVNMNGVEVLEHFVRS